jgi:hypothetical protein
MKPHVLTGLICLGLSLGTVCGAQAQVPRFSHIFVIVLENKEYGDVIGNPAAPYINGLARQHGLATNEFAVVHPSLPNYMALTSGDTFFTDDCVGCQIPAANLMDRIEASGRTWTAYLEDMPAACSATDAGLYVAQHNPFVHYTNIISNPTRCANSVVPFSRFNADLSAGRLSNFVWITPNLCNDMHDCPVATGDAWLAGFVPQLLQSSAFDNALLLVVWEGVTAAGGRGTCAADRRLGRDAGRAAGANDVHSLQRAAHDRGRLGPGALGQSANASAMTAFFPSPSQAPIERGNSRCRCLDRRRRVAEGGGSERRRYGQAVVPRQRRTDGRRRAGQPVERLRSNFSGAGVESGALSHDGARIADGEPDDRAEVRTSCSIRRTCIRRRAPSGCARARAALSRSSGGASPRSCRSSASSATPRSPRPG